MTYTFLSRRRLNELLRQQHPDLLWDEDKGNGTPRMRIITPPMDITPIMSYNMLESRAASYFLLHHTPMPVYLKVQGLYEVNYVHPNSQNSLNEAARWIDKHLIYS